MISLNKRFMYLTLHKASASASCKNHSLGIWQFLTFPPPTICRGFASMVKRNPKGIRFTELMDRVSRINPEIRIRFTSPHPKDFPDDVHIPADRLS